MQNRLNQETWQTSCQNSWSFFTKKSGCIQPVFLGTVPAPAVPQAVSRPCLEEEYSLCQGVTQQLPSTNQFNLIMYHRSFQTYLNQSNVLPSSTQKLELHWVFYNFTNWKIRFLFHMALETLPPIRSTRTETGLWIFLVWVQGDCRTWWLVRFVTRHSSPAVGPP